MKNIKSLRIALALLASLPAIDGTSDTVTDFVDDYHTVISKVENHESKDNESPFSTSSKYLVSGLLLLAAHKLGNSTEKDEKLEREDHRNMFAIERPIPIDFINTNLYVSDFANALNKSGKEIEVLLGYIFKYAEGRNSKIDKLIFFVEANKLFTSIRGFLDSNRMETIEKVLDLLCELLEEKVDHAAKISIESEIDLDQSLRVAVNQEISEGKEELIRKIELFKKTRYNL